VAPIPGYFQTTNEGAPGPSHSGTGDATDLNPESVRDAPGQSPEVAIADVFCFRLCSEQLTAHLSLTS
jgi:hypothetical protein